MYLNAYKKILKKSKITITTHNTYAQELYGIWFYNIETQKKNSINPNI